jgi:hypothetical protein
VARSAISYQYEVAKTAEHPKTAEQPTCCRLYTPLLDPSAVDCIMIEKPKG